MNKFLTSTKEYFVGAYHEIKKVTWPTKKQVINYSLVVITMSLGIAVFFGILDYFFSLGLNNLLS